MERKFSSFYEDGREDGITEGIAKGKAEAEQNFAVRLLKATAMSITEIAALANLALDQVEELAKTIRKPQSAN
ncbi:MAG: hypothetical protein ACI4PS_05485 [Rhodocyclaceae bacterium]